jgi:hypothetical protein
MKHVSKILLAVVFILFFTSMADAKYGKFCKKNISPNKSCDTELPLIYSDSFQYLDEEFWFTDHGRARVNRRGWLNLRHDTITSMDHSELNLNDFRIILYFKAWKWRSPEFTINFTTGEEIVFSYKKIKAQKRRRQNTRKRFSVTTRPVIADESIPLQFYGRWKTLLVDYDSKSGVISLDTNNDCNFDYVLQWEPGLQFSYVTGSNQKWDFFEFYAAQGREVEAPSSIPVYQLEWAGIGEGARGLAVDSHHNVYVSSPFDNNVKKFDENGNLLEEWPDFVNPQGIAVDQDNHIYIADSGSSSIKKYDTDGVLISELPRFGDAYELRSVQDVAVDAQGIVYVSSFNIWFDAGIVLGSKIFKFTTDWEFIGEIIPGIDSVITGLDVDSTGNIYLATSEGIQKYDSGGNYLMDIGTVSGGDGEGEFSVGSHDVFINESDLLFATDGGGNNRIQVFDTNGAYLYEWGTEGSASGEFLEPSIIFDSPDGIYILDSGNNRVQKFQ